MCERRWLANASRERPHVKATASKRQALIFEECMFTPKQIAALAFLRWLVATGRVSEEI